MPVHPNSVISPTIANIDQAFYTKLTDMENYCYTSSTTVTPVSNAYNVFSPEFTNLSNAIVAWMTNDGGRGAALEALIKKLFVYKSLNNSYNFTFSGGEAVFNAGNIFTINGFIQTVMNYPLNYYDDYDPVNKILTNLPNDVTFVNGASQAEVNNINALTSQLESEINAFSTRLMFEDVPPAKNPPTTKIDIGTWIYTTFGYKNYITLLNLSCYVPPYV